MPVLAQLLLGALLQLPVSSDSLGFRFTVPPGFVEYPEGRGTNTKIVDCWAEEGADSTAATLVLCVSRLGLTMGTDTLEAKDLPPNARRLHYTWREFDLQGFAVPLTRADGELIALSVQVPLRREAMQLTLAGPPSEEARADSIMRVTLASFEGESNWLTRGQRAEKLGEVVGYWLSGAIGIAVLAWIYRRRKAAESRSRPVRRPPPSRPSRSPNPPSQKQ